MCLFVYLGSSRPVQRLAWTDGDPLGVRDLADSEAAVLDRLGTAKACAVEAWEGTCGCAFWRGEPPPEDDEDREEQRRNSKSIDALAALLRECLRTEARVRLYACWTGDEAEPIESTRHVDLTHFADPVFELVESELLIIRA